MNIKSKQYLVSLSCYAHHIKIHTIHKGVFPSFFLETQRYKCMVGLTLLVTFLSSSLCASHGLCWLWQCHCKCGRSRMPEELSDSRYGMCKYRLFIPSWKHINQGLFYNCQLQLDSSSRETFQDMFSLWSLQYKTHCVSGCVCPPDQVLDGKGGCIAPEDCPCIHNGDSYSPGESIRVGCNNW